ncbi:MAG: hypothetical protein M1821_001493 [Bathelium mastoideum]|nr:MAG: hypothetical protein M1821_001493 [Bathelium mastoideum]
MPLTITPLHPLEKLQNRQVSQWMAEVDRLSLEFANEPAVQLGIRYQHSHHASHARHAALEAKVCQPISLPPLFQCLTLCNSLVPGQPIKFHSRGFRSSSSGLQAEVCRSLGRLSQTCEDSMLSSYPRDDERPGFLLHLTQYLRDAQTGKQTWILGSSIDITDAIRECAIEFTNNSEAGTGMDEPAKHRRNAITEFQIFAGTPNWFKTSSTEDFRENEEGTVFGSPASSSSSLARSLNSMSSSTTTFSTEGTSQFSESPGLAASAGHCTSCEFSALSTQMTARMQTINSLRKLVKEIRDHHHTYFLMAPPTLPLRSRPSPRYTFTQYRITHVCPSLHEDDSFQAAPSSPPRPSKALRSVDEMSPLSQAGGTIPYKTSSSQSQDTPFTSPFSQRSSFSRPHTPCSPSRSFVTQSPRQHGRGSDQPSTPRSAMSDSPCPPSPKSLPQLTTARIFQYTASTTLASISDSMAVGKAFKEYVMFSEPSHEARPCHGTPPTQDPSQSNKASHPRTPRSPVAPLDSVVGRDEERGTGKWLCGVPMGDEREDLIGCWVCWVLDSEKGTGVMEI